MVLSKISMIDSENYRRRETGFPLINRFSSVIITNEGSGGPFQNRYDIIKNYRRIVVRIFLFRQENFERSQ